MVPPSVQVRARFRVRQTIMSYRRASLLAAALAGVAVQSTSAFGPNGMCSPGGWVHGSAFEPTNGPAGAYNDTSAPTPAASRALHSHHTAWAGVGL